MRDPHPHIPEDWPNRSKSRFVEAGGVTFHVQILGEGPTIFMIHGTGASTHSWHRMIPYFEGYQLVMMDLPGQGFSSALPANSGIDAMADSLAALIDVLDIDPIAVIGHSAGAALAIRLGLNAAVSEDCKIFALNAALKPYGGLLFFIFSPFAKLLALTPFVARVTAKQAAADGAVERFMDETGSILQDQDIAYYRTLFSNPDHIAATLKMMADWNLKPLLQDAKHLSQPVTLLAGRDDGTVNYTVSEGAAKRFPKATVQLFDEAGHLMHEETPEPIAQAILQHM